MTIELPPSAALHNRDRHEDETPCTSACPCPGGQQLAIAETKARAAVLDRLGVLTETYRGADVRAEGTDAAETVDLQEDAYYSQWPAEAHMAMDIQVLKHTVDLLAGMVAANMAGLELAERRAAETERLDAFLGRRH